MKIDSKQMGRYMIKWQPNLLSCYVMIGSSLATYLSTFVNESGQQFSIFFSLTNSRRHTYFELVSDNIIKLLQSGKCNQTHANSIFHCTASHIHTHPSVWLTISNQSWGINQLDCTYFSVCLSWTKYLLTYLVLSHLNTWLFCVHCWIYSNYLHHDLLLYQISVQMTTVLLSIPNSRRMNWGLGHESSLPIIYILISDQHSLTHTNWQLASYRLNTCITIMTDLHHTKTLPSSQIVSTNWVGWYAKALKSHSQLFFKHWADALVRKLQVLLQQVQVHTYLHTAPLKSRHCWFYWVSSS